MSTTPQPRLETDQQIADYAHYLHLIQHKSAEEICRILIEKGIDEHKAEAFSKAADIPLQQVHADISDRARRQLALGAGMLLVGILLTAIFSVLFLGMILTGIVIIVLAIASGNRHRFGG